MAKRTERFEPQGNDKTVMSSCTRPTDLLLLRAQRGDTSAFEEFYDRLLPAVIAFVHSRTGRGAPVEDLVQEVFARVWEGRTSFESRSSARTYVLGVALNVVRQYRQEDRAGLVALERLDLPDTRTGRCEHELERREILGFLGRARLALTEAQSTAITLVYDQQMTRQEAADALGCTEKALTRRLEKARRKLRAGLTANASARKQRLAGKSPEDV